jgi:tight adherence protein B
MTAAMSAAGLLAAALLMAPPPPRRRLLIITSHRRRIAGWSLFVFAAGAMLVAPPALGLAATLAIAVIGWRHRRRIRDRRRRGEARAMAAALEVLVGELRVGAHPVRAFAIAADESAGSVGKALRAVATRAELGADVGAGLRAAAAGSSVPAYWDRLAVCWQLAAEHGLAMSTLMRTAHGDIVGRQRFADQVQAGLAGARATAAILAGLPFLGVALGELIGADPIRFLLGGGAGGWLLVVGVSLVVMGVAWSDRIIDRLTT